LLVPNGLVESPVTPNIFVVLTSPPVPIVDGVVDDVVDGIIDGVVEVLLGLSNLVAMLLLLLGTSVNLFVTVASDIIVSTTGITGAVISFL